MRRLWVIGAAIVAVASLIFLCAFAMFALGAIGDGVQDFGTCPPGLHIVKTTYFDPVSSTGGHLNAFCEDADFHSFPLPSGRP